MLLLLLLQLQLLLLLLVWSSARLLVQRFEEILELGSANAAAATTTTSTTTAAATTTTTTTLAAAATATAAITSTCTTTTTTATATTAAATATATATATTTTNTTTTTNNNNNTVVCGKYLGLGQQTYPWTPWSWRTRFYPCPPSETCSDKHRGGFKVRERPRIPSWSVVAWTQRTATQDRFCPWHQRLKRSSWMPVKSVRILAI